MSKLTIVSSVSAIALGLAIVSAQAGAASIVNNDAVAHTVQINDGSTTSEVEIGAGDEVTVCEQGCTLTVNDQSLDVKGDDKLEIVDGALKAAE
ncbi:MAG: hypothetical protein H6844_09370 [Alphaproteobacteria bacterium]|nr:hypothetical protein [Alphaproteobacteria bacterium]